MKKLYYLIILSFALSSCEDVIEVAIPNTAPRLVIDAGINWFNGTSGNEQIIKLTLSAPYFDTEIPPATGAQITITNANNTIFNFIENVNDAGVYTNNRFLPKIDATYNLTIIYDNEIYTATETLKSVTPIDYIEQINDGGFGGDEIEIKAFYTDPANQDNFYGYQFLNTETSNQALKVYDDEFIDGNQIFAFFTDEDLEQGNELIIRNFGISEQFYEYMFILLQQNGVGNGGPFGTQPATVRGNCINETNTDNFPFGYFRLSQANEFRYTLE